jgi:NAD(P)-dependent dehydrogenase (short-subunit alcohol dehydrogenase family)
LRLEGKVAIVSAAGRGIGRTIALTLAKEGADVVVNSLQKETTAAVAREIEALGRRAVAVVGDACSDDVVAQVVQKTLDSFGKVDILVNNVGHGKVNPLTPGSGPLQELMARWDGTYEQTIRAPVLMCESVVPHFKKQKSGRIVNIGSVMGRYTASANALTNGFLSPAYSAMKAGILSYTQVLAQILGPHNVTVNCVCPGIVLTDAWKRNSRMAVTEIDEFKGQDPDEWLAGIAEDRYPRWFPGVPLNESPTVGDVAQAVLFFASDEARHLTAQIVNVDSGQFIVR